MDVLLMDTRLLLHSKVRTRFSLHSRSDGTIVNRYRYVIDFRDSGIMGEENPDLTSYANAFSKEPALKVLN